MSAWPSPAALLPAVPPSALQARYRVQADIDPDAAALRLDDQRLVNTPQAHQDWQALVVGRLLGATCADLASCCQPDTACILKAAASELPVEAGVQCLLSNLIPAGGN